MNKDMKTPEQKPPFVASHIMRVRICVSVTIVLTLVYLGWRIFYTLPFEYGVIPTLSGLSLLIVEFFGLMESFIHFLNMFHIEVPATPEIPPEMFPDVDIYIATYTEPMDLLYKTINGCKHIEYPDKSKIHIHLCDDGHRAEVKEFALGLGINYIDREDHKGAKAGNLNHAMTVTSGQLLLILDSDMIPKHDILLRCAPFFVDAEIKNQNLPEKDHVHIGFIQTPQSFYNPDLFQFNLFSEGRIPNEQDYFYKDLQVTLNETNSPIFGGSNALISRRAINDVGGFYTGSITEDFATGMLIQRKKYRCYALNDVLASGLSPTDLPSLIQQRIRWARGCISTGRQLHIWTRRDLTIRQKMNYWTAIYYWYAPLKRFVYIFSPLIFLVFGFVVFKCTLPQILLFWLPMYVANNITLDILGQNIRTTKWTSIYETVMFPFMLFPVIAESFGISLKKFKVTKKGNPVDETGRDVAFILPFALLLVLSLIGLVRGFGMFLESGVMSPIVTLFWLVTNLFSLVMALFFTIGRKLFRSNDRVLAELDCILHSPEEHPTKCTTIDFSENGISLFLQDPLDIDEKETPDIEIRTDRYWVKIKTQVVHVAMRGDGWRYSFKILDYYNNYDEYLQIIYDRTPTLPERLSKEHSTFDDIRLNSTERKKATFFQNRHYPRIDIDEEVLNQDGEKTRIINFNYKFILLHSDSSPATSRLELTEGLTLHCEFERKVWGGNLLCTVLNYDEIHGSANLSALLSRWLKGTMHRASISEFSQANTEQNLIRDLLGYIPPRRDQNREAPAQPVLAAPSPALAEETPAGKRRLPRGIPAVAAAALLAVGVSWYFFGVRKPASASVAPGLVEAPANPESAIVSAIIADEPWSVLSKTPRARIYTFDSDAVDLLADSPETASGLRVIAEELRRLGNQSVRVEGHAPRRGSYYGAELLSIQQAGRVIDELVKSGFNKSRLDSPSGIGWGSFIPLREEADNRDQGRVVILTPVYTLTESDLSFLPGSEDIDMNGNTAAALDMLAGNIKEMQEQEPDLVFRIEGPIEKNEDAAAELPLSARRAYSIRVELRRRGIREETLEILGRSSDMPLFDPASISSDGEGFWRSASESTRGPWVEIVPVSESLRRGLFPPYGQSEPLPDEGENGQ
ncbi:hypothetical protein AGMMS49546_06480 [Spirochaetia bacterium]|nr:hypothetical protein AGMMS49546_06480 [Spirochaetia bacterium]